jgi:hypothetical protein
MTDDITEQPAGEFLLYRSEDGRTRIECRFDEQTLWLSQAQIADLFQVSVPTINEHLAAIFTEAELEAERTIRSFRIVRLEGTRQVTRSIDHYRLEAILAVGYRVRSDRGTQFRQWATQQLREFLVKGFVMDDERLKNPPGPDVPDYFDELLDRIRDIRSSEKRMYLKVRDIFALAADYRPDAAETQQFFQVIQNKLHWAATGSTAAELIASRADHSAPNMGLTSWKGAKVRRTDVTVAKNYLNAGEIGELNRIITMYLDYAEDQAQRRRVLYMRDWRDKLDAFLQFNERDVLTNAGKVSKEIADRLALNEYDRFHARRQLADAQADESALEAALRQLPTRTGLAKPAMPARSARRPKKS